MEKIQFTLSPESMKKFLHLPKPRGRVDIINTNYIWQIDNFSELCSQKSYEEIKSPTFSVTSKGCDGQSETKMWAILLYPNGQTEKSDKYISLFVQPQVSTSIEEQFTFSILDSKMKKANKIPCSDMMQSTVDGQKRGFTKFINRNFLLQSSDDLLPKDTLRILCEVTVNSINVDSKIPVQVKVTSENK